jgi:exosortase D (VPLPA-CTERM-specific)
MLKKHLSVYSWPRLAAVALALLTFVLVFQKTFGFLYANWQREEYSHGFLIPLICVFLLWRRRDQFAALSLRGSWLGVAVVALGLLLYFLGTVTSIVGADAYALVVVIAGCALAVLGWQGFRLAWAPIALLLLMVPLPTFWYNNLSSQLQLISSQVGVAIIHALGVSAFLEGNVIDLGSYKLEVAEACSGLRYLFPLMTLGAMVAYLFKSRAWTRWCIVLSTVPIAVLMNSLRIGIIGLLVDRFGIAQAEGFLHQFEGWVIFMACFILLLLECKLLLRLSGDRRSFRDVLGLEAQSRPIAAFPGRYQLGKPAIAVALVMMLAVYPAWALPQRAELKPSRYDFSQFPLQLGDWHGRRDRVEAIYLDELKLDDYLLADFVAANAGASGAQRAPSELDATNGSVNLYIAYYASQRTGQAVHSPRSCLPGGGWRIQEISQHEVPGVPRAGPPLRVNRALIQQGEERQLVYYWFQERGRDVTNEYLVKWYLFVDALALNRSDGALVRLITPLREGEDATLGDARLSRFTATLSSTLQRYVPD